MQRYDVCALGELLIDFTENGTSAQGNPMMEANPGSGKHRLCVKNPTENPGCY